MILSIIGLSIIGLRLGTVFPVFTHDHCSGQVIEIHYKVQNHVHYCQVYVPFSGENPR